jgi:hypothetical protein
MRRAAIVADRMDSIEKSLSSEYDLISVPLIDSVQVLYNEPRPGLQFLSSMKRRRAKQIAPRQEQL